MFINVKTYKRKTGRSCMHCESPAKVLATRKYGARKFSLPVAYCETHARRLGAIE